MQTDVHRIASRRDQHQNDLGLLSLTSIQGATGPDTGVR